MQQTRQKTELELHGAGFAPQKLGLGVVQPAGGAAHAEAARQLVGKRAVHIHVILRGSADPQAFASAATRLACKPEAASTALAGVCTHRERVIGVAAVARRGIKVRCAGGRFRRKRTERHWKAKRPEPARTRAAAARTHAVRPAFVALRLHDARQLPRHVV